VHKLISIAAYLISKIGRDVRMGDEFQKAVKKMSEYVKKFSGSTPSFSEQSTSDLQMASTTVSYANIGTLVAVVQPKGQTSPDVIFSAAVCPLPKENLLPFFRQLLVWNNFQTDVAHFSLSDEQGVVFLVLRRPVEGFDYPEFTHAISKISAVTLNSMVMLRKQFGV
jgi:hypothetical protein